MKPLHVAALGLSLAVALPAIAPGTASAWNLGKSGSSNGRFSSGPSLVAVALDRFAAPFVCGSLGSDSGGLVAGSYRTSIQITNLTNDEAQLTARVLLSAPPEAAGPGRISMARRIKIASGQSLLVDCLEIARADFGGEPPATERGQGLVQIQTEDEIGVSVTQTAGSSSGLSMQTFPVAPQSIRVQRMSDGSDKQLVCHAPPGNPDNEQTIEVGEDAVPAHLAHGDYEGYCGEDDDD